MSEFKMLDANAPATLEAVVEAVVRLTGEYDEAELLKIVSDGQLSKVFPFSPKKQANPADFAADEELVQASARPLTREQRASLIQSSMPSSAKRAKEGLIRIPAFSSPSNARRKASSSND